MGIASTIDRRRLSSIFALLHGVVLLLAAVSPQFWVLPLLLVRAGSAMTISNTSANSLLQTTTGASHLGQTVSLYMLAVRGGSSIGALVTGLAINALGVQHALMVNGLIAIVVQGVIAREWLESPPPMAWPRNVSRGGPGPFSG